ncbi:MAG: hypothetical protein QNJ81_00245 [Acidimicrobiia bacterium]|nr:hypothetical protein [Acidimicrobiia bacterium]
MRSDTIKGRSIRPRSRRPKQYASNRVCAQEGCDTLISRYNAKDFCHGHAPKRYPRVRGRIMESAEA